MLLPPKGHEASPTELFQVVVQENVRKWQAPGRRDQTHGPANFREAQIAVSEVLGRLRFNKAAFRGWYEAEQQPAIFKTVGRPILSQEELSDDASPKNVLYFSGLISCRLFRSFSSLFLLNLRKNVRKYYRIVFSEKHVISFSKKSRDFVTKFGCPVTQVLLA